MPLSENDTNSGLTPSSSVLPLPRQRAALRVSTAKPATVASALVSTASSGRISGTGQSCTLIILGCIPATANRLVYVSRTG